jgi:hypothetical protein
MTHGPIGPGITGDLRLGMLVRSRGLRLEQSGTLPFPHPSSAIAEDLHRLLARAAACGAVMSAGVIRWRPAVITI